MTTTTDAQAAIRTIQALLEAAQQGAIQALDGVRLARLELAGLAEGEAPALQTTVSPPGPAEVAKAAADDGWREEVGPTGGDIAAWEREVKAPAEVSEAGGYRYVLEAGKCYVEYRIAPVPGGVAITYDLRGTGRGSASPWRVHPTREACLAALVEAARQLFADGRERDWAGRMLKQIDRLAEGKEPTPERVPQPAEVAAMTPPEAPPGPVGDLFATPQEGPYTQAPEKKGRRKGTRT